MFTFYFKVPAGFFYLHEKAPSLNVSDFQFTILKLVYGFIMSKKKCHKLKQKIIYSIDSSASQNQQSPQGTVYFLAIMITSAIIESQAETVEAELCNKILQLYKWRTI